MNAFVANLVIIGMCTVCYWNSLQNDLVHDDKFAILDNADIRPSTPWMNLFSNDFWGRSILDNSSHKSYRPLVILSFRINYMFHELRPWGYHLVNLALHMAVCSLFYFLCAVALFGNTATSLLSALLFASHPIHTEAVTGVVGRADEMACLFFILSLLFYVKFEKATSVAAGSFYIFLCVICGATATFCKELGITVFGVAVNYSILSVWQSSKSIKLHSKCFFGSLVLCLSSLLLLGLRVLIMRGELPTFLVEDNPASFSESFLTRFLTFNYLFAANGGFLLSPTTLCYDWQGGSIPLITALSDNRNLWTISFYVILMALVVSSFKKFKKDRFVVLFGLSLCVVPFLPASNLFFRVGFVLAERILYIPSLGYCVLVAQGIITLDKHLRKISPKLSTCILLLFTLYLLGVFTTKTLIRNEDWRSRESLFKSGIKTVPHNAKVHYNYANFLKDSGSVDLAIHHYKEAIRIAPEHSSALNNLGTLLHGEEAAFYLKEAVKRNPKHSRAFFNLGNVFYGLEQYDEARKALESCLRLDGKYSDAWSALGGVLIQLQRPSDAEKSLDQTLSLGCTTMEVCLNTATYFEQLNIFSKALTAAKMALNHDSTNYKILKMIGLFHRKLGHNDLAETMYLRSLSFKEDPDTLSLAGSMYFNTKEYEKAKAVFERQLILEPHNSQVLSNYALCLAKLGRIEEAIDLLKGINKELVEPSSEPLKTLVSILVENGRKEEALSYAAMGVDLTEEKDEGLLNILADLYKDRRQYSEAKQVFEAIVHLNPASATAWINFGAICHLLGEYDIAAEHYQKAYSLATTKNTRQLARDNLEKVNRIISRQ